MPSGSAPTVSYLPQGLAHIALHASFHYPWKNRGLKMGSKRKVTKKVKKDEPMSCEWTICLNPDCGLMTPHKSLKQCPGCGSENVESDRDNEP